jgi:hypothetical protein
MRLRSRQRGLGWFGLMFVFGTIALVSIVTVKSFPVYMNQMKISRAVHRVAVDPEMANAELPNIRRALSRYWAIDNIDTLGFQDVKLERTNRGKALTYEYEVRVPLFYNISLLFEFVGNETMAGVAGGDAP